MAGFGFGCFFLFLSLSPYIFIKFYHWSHLEFTLVGIGAALGMSGGSFFERAYLSQWKEKNVILLGLLISISACILMIFISSFFPVTDTTILGLAATLLFGCGLMATASITLAMKHVRQTSGIGAAFVICIKIGFSSFISTSAPIIPENPISATLVFLSLMIAASILAFILRRVEKNEKL